VLRRYVTASGNLRTDDMPVPVLLPENGKNKPGCGCMFAMIAPQLTWRRPQRGLSTRRIAKVNNSNGICA